MAQPQPIDLSAGLQPKSSGIDLSAGFEPMGTNMGDNADKIRTGLAGPSWNVKNGLLDTANEAFNAPGGGTLKRIGKSFGRTALMIPNLVQAAVSGPSEEEKAKGFAPPVLGDQGSITNLPANAFDRVLSLPFKHLAVDPSRQAYQQIQGDVQQAEETQGHPLSTPQQAVRGTEEGISMVPLLGPLLLSIARRIDPGTAPGAPPPDIAGGVTDALTLHALPELTREASPGGLLPGAPKAGELALPATDAVLGKTRELGSNAVQEVRGAFSPESMTAEQAATKAFRPRNSKANWKKEIGSSLPDARRAANALGIDVSGMTLDDALKATSQAKKDVWGEYQQNFSGPNQNVMVDTSPVAGRIRQTLSDRQIEQQPGRANKIWKTADSYSNRNLSLQDVEDRVRELNNETRAIEARYLTDKRAAKLSPANSAKFAERDGLRQLLLSKLDELSGPGAAELRQRYGALNSLEDVISRRIPVAERAAPESLPKTLAKAYAAGKIAKGVLKGPWGIPDVAEGAISLLSARKSALLNDPDYLTSLAFRKTVPRGPMNMRTQAVEPPAQALTGIAGLLPRGQYNQPGGTPPSEPLQLEHMQPVEGEYVNPPLPPIRGLLNRGQYNQPGGFELTQPQLSAKASAIPLVASAEEVVNPAKPVRGKAGKGGETRGNTGNANVSVPVEPNEPQRPVVQSADPQSAELAPRTADTMSDAISMSSPNGIVSNRSRTASLNRLSEKLFGPGGIDAAVKPAVNQPSEIETLTRQAKQFRDLANGGMKPRAYAKKADELEARIAELQN